MKIEDQRRELLKKITNVNASSFDSVAMEVFEYQAVNNPLYAEYLHLIKKNPSTVHSVKEIPFLPISFFKSHQIKTSSWATEQVFTSSGTTGMVTSQHHVRDLEWYQQVSMACFAPFYGSPADYCILALLPSYLERSGSSLVFMADFFIRQSKYTSSGFFLNEKAVLVNTLKDCVKHKIPTILLGVSFALWDLAEENPMALKDVIIMETGGMKGRRQEITRPALHHILKTAFKVGQIHSEYGMTELLSQAYSSGHGIFYPGPSMRVLTREITDPFAINPINKNGVINIIDLANLDSISFIATEDLGKVYEDNSFEIIGRLDASDVRGCNLMVI
jgi:hypothetical protein